MRDSGVGPGFLVYQPLQVMLMHLQVENRRFTHLSNLRSGATSSWSLSDLRPVAVACVSTRSEGLSSCAQGLIDITVT